MFTEPVDGHWDGHITRDNVDRFKHPIHVTPGSRLERLTGKQTILGASMHNYRITHPARSLTVAGRTDDGTIEALEYLSLIHISSDRRTEYVPCVAVNRPILYERWMSVIMSRRAASSSEVCERGMKSSSLVCAFVSLMW